MRSLALAAAAVTGALSLGVVFPAVSNAAPNTSKESQAVVTVQQGDSLTKIADKHDTTYVRLFNANTDIVHPDVIHPGEKVRIPSDDEKLKDRTLPSNAVVPASAPVQPAAPAQTYYTAPQPQATAPAPQPQPRAQATSTQSSGSGVWDQLAQCESGGNWSINTGNGYYGGLQFSQSSWQAAGGSGSPANASKAEQIRVAENLQNMQGWGAWPACSAKLGLR